MLDGCQLLAAKEDLRLKQNINNKFDPVMSNVLKLLISKAEQKVLSLCEALRGCVYLLMKV